MTVNEYFLSLIALGPQSIAYPPCFNILIAAHLTEVICCNQLLCLPDIILGLSNYRFPVNQTYFDHLIQLHTAANDFLVTQNHYPSPNQSLNHKYAH